MYTRLFSEILAFGGPFVSAQGSRARRHSAAQPGSRIGFPYSGISGRAMRFPPRPSAAELQRRRPLGISEAGLSMGGIPLNGREIRPMGRIAQHYRPRIPPLIKGEFDKNRRKQPTRII